MYLRIYWTVFFDRETWRIEVRVKSSQVNEERKNVCKTKSESTTEKKEKKEEEKKMINIEEAEVLENGGVIIRYYLGKTVLIPADVMKKEGIPITRADQVFKEKDYRPQIGLRSRRYFNGNF